MPFASTAKCILVLSPLLYVPCPDSRQPLQRHGDEPCNVTHRSLTTQNQVQLRPLQVFFPTHLRCANDEIVEIQSSSFHTEAAYLATARLYAKPRTLHLKSDDYLRRFRPIVPADPVKVAQEYSTLHRLYRADFADSLSKAPFNLDASIIQQSSCQHNLIALLVFLLVF